MEGNNIFALDIGTRSVVGLVAQKQDDDTLKIIDIEVKEHPERSMVGGQIHDIPNVAKIIGEIKSALEDRLGYSLKSAAVAAAGRSLFTARGRAEMTFPVPQEVSEELFYTLQLEAVRHAQDRIRKLDKTCDYHCVGFSISHQYLDEAAIRNLVGQTGRIVAVEIIATFLPRIVIDSLYGALQKAGLEMEYITLEPIAAFNLAVPDNMRQLNIALIDIGAGTSDIAISEDGTVRGYGMIPMAGDQITETICQAYLLDFLTGESVKRQLDSVSDSVTFTDITGTSYCLSAAEIINTIRETVTTLAHKIAEKVIEINGRPPQAVLCIGGGSLVPTLARELASSLEIPENRVAVTGNTITKPLTSLTDKLSAPQAVTPLAIAHDALYRSLLSVIKVLVNDRPVRLFAAETLTVGDALVAAGIQPSLYLGRLGQAMSLEVNGDIVFIKGQPGQKGIIKVNDLIGELSTSIKEGDKIVFEPGTTGQPGTGTIKDILPENLVDKTILIDGKRVPMLSGIRLNNAPINNYDHPLNDGDKIEYIALETVKDILHYLDIPTNQIAEVTVNHNPVQDFNHQVTPDDAIEIFRHEAVEEKTSASNALEYLSLYLNGEPVSLPVAGGGNPILTDVFNIMKLEPPSGQGKKLIMEVNGAAASFITPIKAGDQIILKWSDNN